MGFGRSLLFLGGGLAALGAGSLLCSTSFPKDKAGIKQEVKSMKPTNVLPLNKTKDDPPKNIWYPISPKEYGLYLINSGKHKQNRLKTKILKSS